MEAAEGSAQVPAEETRSRWGPGATEEDSSDDEDCTLLGGVNPATNHDELTLRPSRLQTKENHLPNVTHSRNMGFKQEHKTKTSPPGRGLKRLRSKSNVEATGEPLAAVEPSAVAAGVSEIEVVVKDMNDILEEHFREREKQLTQLKSDLSEAVAMNLQHVAAFRKIKSSFDQEKEANQELQIAFRKEQVKNYDLICKSRCKICMSAPRNVILFPCMHYEFCKECLKKTKQEQKQKQQQHCCPLDRIPVMSKLVLKRESERD